ncbi:MAG: WecB/TagA/CpsF family glycosyltransferase [Bacteroidota bacterium]
MQPIPILNISIDPYRRQQLLGELKEGMVFTPNVDHLIKLQKDRIFYDAYQQAAYRLCDSRIILQLSRLTADPIPEQLAGSDIFPAFCQYHASNPEIRIFLLGGTQAGVGLAAQKLNQGATYSQVVGHYAPPFGFESDVEETQVILSQIQQSGANVLAVGVGAPKQEIWIATHRAALEALGVKLFFAIGKTIDFLAGETQRAPRWIQWSNLEWLYRFFQEPRRLFRRYFIEGPPFFLLFLRHMRGTYQNPWS